MHARLTSIQLRPGMADRVAEMFHTSVLPAARGQAGFRGGLVLGDPATGKTVLISLWDSEAELQAGEASGYYLEQISKLAGVGLHAGPPARETLEVMIEVRE